MDIEAIKGNEFLGLTGRLPRPSRETHGGKPELLAAAQKRWDDAKTWAEQNDKLRAARLAKVDATERAGRDRAAAADDARAGAKQAAIAAELRARFLAAGGTAAQFEREKDELVLAAIKRAALDGGDAARYAGIM